MRPLAIDLFCGLGGWAEGFLAEGYDVVGFDNHRHVYYVPAFRASLGLEGSNKQRRTRIAQYPAQLVLQDVLTLHGSQFRDAAVIVASPPCQNYSYLAMPWSRSKPVPCVECGASGWKTAYEKCWRCEGKGKIEFSKAAKALRRKWETEGPDNRLFDACFRIQREASEAAGGYIPLIVENVRGAQPWVGRSAWNYGSFHLWGDVPALMPISRRQKRTGIKQLNPRGDNANAGRNRMGLGGVKVPGFRFDGSGRSFQTASVEATGQKVPVYSDPRRNGGKGVNLTSPAENGDGLKIGGDWFSDPNSTCRKHGSRSSARKAASAQIAKIPFELARHIASVYYPK